MPKSFSKVDSFDGMRAIVAYRRDESLVSRVPDFDLDDSGIIMSDNNTGANFLHPNFQMRALLLPVSLALLLLPRIAAACVLVPKPTVLDAYQTADVVVIARAIKVEKVSDQSPSPPTGSRVLSTTMEVQKVFKGNLRVGDKMTFGQGNGLRCTWVFYEQDIGNEYLFYLKTPPKDSNLWYEFGYGRSDLISRVADDLLYLNNIEAVRGKTRVSGTLDPGEDEQDVVGKKIRIMAKEKVYETTTDKNGVYEFYDLPAGKYVLEPEVPPGWKIDPTTRGTTTIRDRKRQIFRTHIVFTLKPQQHAAIDLSFVLDYVTIVNVVDPRGKPLPQVEVWLKATDAGNHSVNFAYTNEKGWFSSPVTWSNK